LVFHKNNYNLNFFNVLLPNKVEKERFIQQRYDYVLLPGLPGTLRVKNIPIFIIPDNRYR